MIKKQKRVVKKYKKLPPHSDEPHPIAHAGEVSKPFLISVITIVLLVLISLLIFFGDTFTGKAVHFEEFTPTGNQGGIFDKDNKIEFEEVGDSFDFPVSVHATTDSNAVRFAVTYDPTIVSVDCPDVSALDKLFKDGELKLHSKVECIPGEIRYEYAALSLGGEVEGTEVVAKLKVKALKEGKTKLDFSDFEIYDAKTGDELSVTTTSPEVIVGFKGCKEEKVAVNKLPIVVTSNDLPVLLKDGTFGPTPYTQKINIAGNFDGKEWDTNNGFLSYEVNFATPVVGDIKKAKGEGGEFDYVSNLEMDIELMGKKYHNAMVMLDGTSASLLLVPVEDISSIEPGKKVTLTSGSKNIVVEYTKFENGKAFLIIDGDAGEIDSVMMDNFDETHIFGVPLILPNGVLNIFFTDSVINLGDGALWINNDKIPSTVTINGKVEGKTYSLSSFKIAMSTTAEKIIKYKEGRLSEQIAAQKSDSRTLMNNLFDLKITGNSIQVGKLCPPYTPTKKIDPVELEDTKGVKDISALLTQLEFTYKGKVWVSTEVFDPNNNDVAYKRELLDALPAKFEQKISYQNINNIGKKVFTVRNDNYDEIKRHEKKYTK